MRRLFLALLVAVASASRWPHVYYPCYDREACPDACIQREMNGSNVSCVATTFIPNNPNGIFVNLDALRTDIRGVTIANSTINSTFVMTEKPRPFEYLDAAQAPSLKNLVFLRVQLNASDVESWVVPPTITTLLMFNCSLRTLPNLTWPKLDFLDISNNTQLTQMIEQDINGDLATQYPFLRTLTGIGLSSLGLKRFPKFLFRIDNLNRLFMRYNKLDVVTLSPAEYAFLTRPGMELHVHTFNNTKIRDDDAPDRLPTCPESQVITLLYNSSKGNSWFVCVTAPESSTQLVATVLAWIVLVSMGCTILYLLFMRFMRSRKPSDADTGFSLPLPNRMFPIVHPSGSGTAFSLDALVQSTTLVKHAIPWSQVELLTCVHNTKQEVTEAIWLETTTNDVTEIWKGVCGNQQVLVKRVTGGEVALRVFLKQLVHLSQVSHAHITDLVGVTWHNNSLAILCAANDPTNPTSSFVDLKQIIPSVPAAKMQTQIATHIALALRFLHSVPQVHGNLHSTSIVVDPSTYSAYLNRLEMIPCDVSKLGLARQSLYVAPEVVSGGPHSTAADVYSFGMLLAELDTGESVFHFLNRSARCVPGRHDLTVTQMLPLRHALTFNRGPLQPAIVLCLQDKPQSRPPISYLMSLLN